MNRQKNMIAGKNESEILSMSWWTRGRWYKIISPEEKAKAMKIVNTIRYAKISINMMGKNGPFYGKHHSKKHKAKISAGMTGEKHYNWQGGISFEPYCPAFNDGLKEHIRNFCNRTCIICGKSTLQNVNGGGMWLGRLSVDHIDENKMQGCDNWEWRLTALCPSCHGKMQKQKVPRHLLLQLLLVNNKRQQTNILLGGS